MTWIVRYTYPGTTSGKPVGDVYVTGPHFEEDIWSHTYDPNKAAGWSRRKDADAEVARRHWPDAHAVELATAPTLKAPA